MAISTFYLKSQVERYQPTRSATVSITRTLSCQAEEEDKVMEVEEDSAEDRTEGTAHPARKV